MIHHRTPEFSALLERVLTNLRKVFETKQPVLIHSCVGTGVMEAAFVNLLSPDDDVLVVNAGKFGERWLKIADAYGVNAIEIKVPWGESVNSEDVSIQLKKNKNIKAIFCQVSETSTGALHPIKEISEIVRKTETLFVVDAITAIGMTDLKMDDWGIDVMVAGSQKAFMLPPGLGFISLSPRAWEKTKTSKLPKFYFDLQAELKANESNQTRFSSSVGLIRALDIVLKLLLKMGLENYKSYVKSISNSLTKSLVPMGFSIFPKTPSPALTTLSVPKDIDGTKLRNHLETQYNITIAGGQNQLKGKIIRIGHMGYILSEDILSLIEGLGLSLIDLGHKTDIAHSIEVANQHLIESGF